MVCIRWLKYLLGGKKILDVFLTNCPLLWKPGKVHKGLVRSDHLAVTVLPSIPAKPQRKYVSFRDTRDHRKIAMETKIYVGNCKSRRFVSGRASFNKDLYYYYYY